MIQRSPNHTRGRTPCALSSSERVSVACSKRAIRVSRHSSRPKKNGELAPTASWMPAMHWAAFQWRANAARVDELVQLDARARGLGRDRVGVHRQPLDAVDRQVQVLPAGGEDLLVEERVARVGAQHRAVEQRLAERRQDADHQQPRVRLLRALLGVVEARPHRRLELAEHAVGEAARRDVDLDVELGQLGLPVRVGDHLQHVLVGQRRVAGLLGDVELDLEPDRAAVGVEPRLGEHAREHVETPLDLLAVALAVFSGEDPGGDLVPHSAQSARSRAF